jgi:hypothetical protein
MSGLRIALIALFIALICPVNANAQSCTGQFQPGTICGNAGTLLSPPSPIAFPLTVPPGYYLANCTGSTAIVQVCPPTTVLGPLVAGGTLSAPTLGVGTFPAGTAASPGLVLGVAGSGLFEAFNGVGISVGGVDKFDCSATVGGQCIFLQDVNMNNNQLLNVQIIRGGNSGAASIVIGTNEASSGIVLQSGVQVVGATLDSKQNFILNNAALATTATDGFLYIASGVGAPTGVPTAYTGRVPLYIDTTNSQLWLRIGGAWRQPKTPSGAALVTWQ